VLDILAKLFFLYLVSHCRFRILGVVQIVLMSILKPNGKAVGHIRVYDSPNVKRRKMFLDNKKRNYAVTNGDRVETQHLRLHLHFSPIGSWRKVKEGKGPAGLRGRRRTLARKRATHVSARAR